jgi:hypothetical protein
MCFSTIALILRRDRLVPVCRDEVPKHRLELRVPFFRVPHHHAEHVQDISAVVGTEPIDGMGVGRFGR